MRYWMRLKLINQTLAKLQAQKKMENKPLNPTDLSNLKRNRSVNPIM